jgi:cytochrome oxidase Cu insertion factor (SCO1/SenC/PrrC family)
MPLPGWVKGALVALVVVVSLFVVLAGAGLWFLASRATPDVTIGDSLPDVRLTGLDGTPIDLESYAGQVVVLDFWSSW